MVETKEEVEKLEKKIYEKKLLSNDLYRSLYLVYIILCLFDSYVKSYKNISENRSDIYIKKA